MKYFLLFYSLFMAFLYSIYLYLFPSRKIDLSKVKLKDVYKIRYTLTEKDIDEANDAVELVIKLTTDARYCIKWWSPKVCWIILNQIKQDQTKPEQSDKSRTRKEVNN